MAGKLHQRFPFTRQPGAARSPANKSQSFLKEAEPPKAVVLEAFSVSMNRRLSECCGSLPAGVWGGAKDCRQIRKRLAEALPATLNLVASVAALIHRFGHRLLEI